MLYIIRMYTHDGEVRESSPIENVIKEQLEEILITCNYSHYEIVEMTELEYEAKSQAYQEYRKHELKEARRLDRLEKKQRKQSTAKKTPATNSKSYYYKNDSDILH